MYPAAQFAHDLLTLTAEAVDAGRAPEEVQPEVEALVKRFLTPPETVQKFDDEQRLVWGWALVSVEKGQPVTDRQGDVVDTGELQKTVHKFMDDRTGKAMHKGHRVGTVVDSIVFTKELQDALGVDLGREGWFVGMHVPDDATWMRVKKGELKAFSIGGEGERHDYVELLTKWSESDHPRGKGGRFKAAVADMAPETRREATVIHRDANLASEAATKLPSVESHTAAGRAHTAAGQHFMAGVGQAPSEDWEIARLDVGREHFTQARRHHEQAAQMINPRVKKAASFAELLKAKPTKAEEQATKARENSGPIPHAPGTEKHRAKAITDHACAHCHLTTEQSAALLKPRSKIPLSATELEAHMAAHLKAGGKRDPKEEEKELKAKQKEDAALGLVAKTFRQLLPT
jgi:hypothetical protein